MSARESEKVVGPALRRNEKREEGGKRNGIGLRRGKKLGLQTPPTFTPYLHERTQLAHEGGEVPSLEEGGLKGEEGKIVKTGARSYSFILGNTVLYLR